MKNLLLFLWLVLLGCGSSAPKKTVTGSIVFDPEPGRGALRVQPIGLGETPQAPSVNEGLCSPIRKEAFGTSLPNLGEADGHMFFKASKQHAHIYQLTDPCGERLWVACAIDHDCYLRLTPGMLDEICVDRTSCCNMLVEPSEKEGVAKECTAAPFSSDDPGLPMIPLQETAE